jgi:hypothetical protein
MPNRLRTPASDVRRPYTVLAPSHAGLSCRNRVVEWLCAIMLLNFGLTTTLTPATLGEGSFRYMIALNITPALFASVTLIVGTTRVVALYFNGYGLPWSARVRALCSMFGAAVFGLMGLSLVYLTKDTGWLSLGAGTHFALCGVELYSCLRAGADVAENYRRIAMATTLEQALVRHEQDNGRTNATA